MESDKIKLLDNYQLYVLINSKSIDKITLEKLNREFKLRNLKEEEITRLKNKYQLNDITNNINTEKQLNPMLTAFALNTHFRYLAKLKIQGKQSEVKDYMIKLYIGLIFYFAIIILLIYIFKAF